MTFSLLARCRETGQLGAVVTTSDIAVGARVLYARAEVGVAVTQHRTDPRLGPALLDQLTVGAAPDDAVSAVAGGDRHRDWRQLGVLDTNGTAGAFTGARAWQVAGALSGPDCVVLGNMLVSERVLDAIVASFADAPGALASRLVRALTAGSLAGGEGGGLRSAALLVVERESFPLVDLRVDAADDPLAELDALWRTYEPLAGDFVTRALDPDNAHGSSSTTT